MKNPRHAFIVALAFIGSALYSQNSLTIKDKVKNQSLGSVVVEYSDKTTDDITIGDKGNYKFAIGTKEVISITVLGVTCRVGEEVTVKLPDGDTSTLRLLESIQDESRSFNSIIR
jgi:hypothetical protein